MSLPDPAFVITRSGLYAAVYGGRDSRYYHDGSALIGLNVREFMPHDQAVWLISEVEHTLAVGHLHIIEYPLSSHDINRLNGVGPAETLWFEARIKALPFQVGGEDAVLWVASNITARHRLETDLRRLSQTDGLTGLWNRRHFETIAHNEYRAAQQKGATLSVLMIDIDHFKRINDTLGHITGDKMLIAVAGILSDHLRDVDFASRWGGEEFVVLLPESSLVQSVAMAEHMRLAVSSFGFDGNTQLTISIGVASCEPARGLTSLSDLIAQADAALYRAKGDGRNCVRMGLPQMSDSHRSGAA
ncbi:GGDEF domain-containing protein [Oryzibacter oryziterrae]|uniref:GGDEF domain-containing protein n=1 Tax=Oryzibacter oryziterrae TaxID=2766474 RepID=UPI001F19472A|nr:sensor domain-containing diguanylate cyclase [Oryzibacter oryziterrae]